MPIYKKIFKSSFGLKTHKEKFCKFKNENQTEECQHEDEQLMEKLSEDSNLPENNEPMFTLGKISVL